MQSMIFRVSAVTYVVVTYSLALRFWCHHQVVGDMMKGPSGSGPRATSAAELDSYIRHPPTVGGRVVPVSTAHR